MAEVPGGQLLAMEVIYIGTALAVLAGLVAELSQVRVASHLEQFSFGTWRLGLRLHDLGCLAQGELSLQQG
jgi:hypothetical protein